MTPRTDTRAFPTVAQQMGKGGCPGGSCHTPTVTDKPLLPPVMKPTQADQPAMLNWMQSQKKSAPTGNAHSAPPGMKLPAPSTGFPSVQEQQGTPCPNCHSTTQKKDPFGGVGGFGRGPNGAMTDADRQRLLDFVNAQGKR